MEKRIASAIFHDDCDAMNAVELAFLIETGTLLALAVDNLPLAHVSVSIFSKVYFSSRKISTGHELQ
jgi:hypothetical protein